MKKDLTQHTFTHWFLAYTKNATQSSANKSTHTRNIANMEILNTLLSHCLIALSSLYRKKMLLISANFQKHLAAHATTLLRPYSHNTNSLPRLHMHFHKRVDRKCKKNVSAHTNKETQTHTQLNKNKHSCTSKHMQ